MKHLHFLPLWLLISVLLVLSLAGCGETPETVHEHRYGEWYVVTPATHEESGLEARNCTGCKQKETRETAPTGHTFRTEWDYDATAHFHSCSCGATEEKAPHDLDESGVCRTCRVDSTRLAYTKENGVITMGTYPQSRVTDSQLTDALTAAAGTLPTAENAGAWTPYGDCTAKKVEGDFMWYIDLSLEGERYRGVYFTHYRPMSPGIPSDEKRSEQDDNGFATGTVYWFRFEPVRWRILTQRSGRALLLADLILDAVPYQDNVRESPETKDPSSTVTDANGAPDGTYANVYAYSRVRQFLTDEFSRTAFTEKQAALLAPTSTAGDYSQVSESGDRVFLITAGDLLAYCGGAAAQFRRGSDYAACRGLRMMHEDNRFFGGGYWFLRTPRADVANASNKLRCEITASVCMVMATGNNSFSTSQNTTRVDYTFVGTVPAVWLTLAEAESSAPDGGTLSPSGI